MISLSKIQTRLRGIRTVMLVAGIGFAALLTSCESGSSDDTDRLLTGVEVATSVPTYSADSDDIRRGGILVLDTDDCGIFDPAIDLANARGFPNLRLANEIHAGLTRIGADAPYAPEPELAASFEPSSGGAMWEFALRPGLKFSDGSALVSSDVKWSWERALRKSTPPSRARAILGDIVGAGDVIDGSTSELTGINLIDDQRFTVELAEPRTDFPTMVADPIASVVKPANAELWDDIWSNHEESPDDTLAGAIRQPNELPFGAGPFRLVSYETPSRVLDVFAGDSTCTLERNEHYWHPSKPYVDGVIANADPNLFWSDGDAASRQIAVMQTNALDFATMDATADVPASGLTADGFTTMLVPLGVHSRFLVFDPTVPPFDDINVRRALVMSADLSRDANRFEVAPTFGLVPPDFLPNAASVTTLAYDPDAAKAGFDATEFANVSGGPTLTRQLDTLGFIDPILANVLEAWSDVLGIDVDAIATLDAEDNAGIADVRFIHSLPAPGGVLSAAIESFPPDSNRAEFAELRAVLDDAVAEVDQVQRVAKYVELEQRMIDDAYVMPILMVETGKVLVMQPWVNDLRYPKFTGSAFRDVWFDDSAPQRVLPSQ